MEFLNALWKYIVTSAPFLMFGLLISGFIHVFISTDKIKEQLGGRGLKGIFKASFLGIPLPLCSCAVIPTAATLKKSGASNSSTSAFLISTPESGVDSIAMTYGLMDLPMTIIRPVAAFVSAFFAGILQLLFNESHEKVEEVKKSSCCSKSKAQAASEGFGKKLEKSFKFSFIELIDDFAFWLTLGIVAGAMIDFIVPANFFDGLGGWSGKLIILAIGVPLYICASATTPVAASLVMKGMSPGTALIILLVGPATNISNILVIGQYIGKRGVILNIFSIVLVALGFSFLVDYLYGLYSWPLNFKIGGHEHNHTMWWETLLAVVFSLLLTRSLVLKEIPKLVKKLKKTEQKSCCASK